MMKKAFQLAYTLELAGTETVIMNWYRNIDRAKLQFDFGVRQSYDNAFAQEIRKMDGKIIVIPETGGILGKLKFRFALYKKLKEYGPYIAFQTHGYWWSGLDCLIAKLAGIPKRFTMSHFSDGLRRIPWYKKVMRPVCRLAIRCFSTQRFAVSSEAGLALYGNHLDFHIICNGIELKKFAYNPVIRAQKRAELHLQDKLVGGHIGRFCESKNQQFLIDIFASIHQKNPKSHLLLLGTGEWESKIRQKVAQFGLTSAVSFMGSRTDVQDFYQAFDVFVFPSLYEGLGIVAIEAQCSGLPCIVSDEIPSKARVCNTYALSLNDTPSQWAAAVLDVTKHFIRKDESDTIRKAGFDAAQIGQFIETEYLK